MVKIGFVPLVMREISLGPSTMETEKCMAMLKYIDVINYLIKSVKIENREIKRLSDIRLI